MKTDEYRAILARLGWSQVGAAPMLGLSRRQAQRIAAGDCPVPGPVDRLLHMLIALPTRWRNRLLREIAQ